MTEQAPRSVQVAWPPRTGVAGVDDALAEVAPAFGDALDVQVAAVERAHERLRAALDDTA